MSVKVLGVGCASCHEQYEQAKAAVKSMGLDVEVEYITDLQKVVGYGAMSMPALVVNEKVVAMGKVLKAAAQIRLLKGACIYEQREKRYQCLSEIFDRLGYYVYGYRHSDWKVSSADT